MDSSRAYCGNRGLRFRREYKFSIHNASGAKIEGQFMRLRRQLMLEKKPKLPTLKES
jgi:hypothetical protein